MNRLYSQCINQSLLFRNTKYDMIILTKSSSWVTKQVQNHCIFTQILLYFCNHGNLKLDVNQMLMTTTHMDDKTLGLIIHLKKLIATCIKRNYRIDQAKNDV